VLQDTELLLENVKISESLQRINKFVSFANKYFDKKQVWKVINTDKKNADNTLYNCVQIIEGLRVILAPFIPNAVHKLTQILGKRKIEWEVKKDNWKFEKVPSGQRIEKVEVLFKKLDPEIADIERAKLKSSKS
jgi:methionyl-tRNA synthetase